MADFDDGYDDDFYFDDDYLYVEDSYAIADELAENAIPAPAFLDSIDDEFFEDYDHYDYWMDIEYGTDEYYDAGTSHASNAENDAIGLKRKRQSGVRDSFHGKRQKLGNTGYNGFSGEAAELLSMPRVLWMPISETHTIAQKPPTTSDFKEYALFPDWRQRFKTASGLVDAKFQSPDATETSHIDSEENNVGQEGSDVGEEEQGVNMRGGDGPSDDDSDPGIDPELLMSALSSKLEGSGLGQPQQAVFMQSIMQMLSEGGGANLESMLEELTTSVLNKAAEDGEDSATAQWLSDQGVSLALGEDDAESNIHESMVGPGKPKQILSSPRDSAVSVQQTQQMDEQASLGTQAPSEPHRKGKEVSFTTPEEIAGTVVGAEMLEPIAGAGTASVKSPTTDPITKGSKPLEVRKRKAVAEDSQPEAEPAKRRLRSFAAPTASSQSKAAGPTKKTTRSSKPR